MVLVVGSFGLDWEDDVVGLQLGKAVHLSKVVQQSPDMGRHGRSNRNMRSNWVEAKFICYVLHAHQFSLRTSVTVTSLDSTRVTRLLPLHSIVGKIEVVVAISISRVVQDTQSKTQSSTLPSSPFLLCHWSWTPPILLEILLGPLSPPT